MIYLELFISFFQIGLFSIGGGYAALPLIENQVVIKHQWLSMVEFADIITISQMTPGPIAINAATFVGTRIGGILGSIVATLGCVTPSFIIVLILAYFYFRYKQLSVIKGILSFVRPVVVALIASAGLSVIILTFWGGAPISANPSDIDFIAVLLFTASLVVLLKFKPNPIYVMAGSGIVGIGLYLLTAS